MFVRSLDRIRRDTRGQSLAEFALAAPILMLLLFGIFEFSRHYYARLGIRHAVAEAARFHATGQMHPDPDDPEGDPFDDRAASIEHVINSRAAELGLTVTDIDIYVVPVEGEEPTPGGGAEGDLIRVEADLEFHFLAGPMLHILPGDLESVDFTVATTYRNEPRF